MQLGQFRFDLILAVFCAVIPSFALGGETHAASRDKDLDGERGADRFRRPCGGGGDGRRTCDLRSQYCDEVLGRCTSCADDCHPGRIRGDAVATNECRVLCELYYKHLISKKGNLARGLVDDHHDDSGNDGDDDDAVRMTNEDDDDESSHVDKLSRRELRLLIQLELLKMQSTISLDAVFYAIIMTALIIAFISFRLFANRDEMRARLMAVGPVDM